jgi:hypothetical protein
MMTSGSLLFSPETREFELSEIGEPVIKAIVGEPLLEEYPPDRWAKIMQR